MRRGGIQDRFGMTAGGQPVRQRHRLQALYQGLAAIGHALQPEQGPGGLVEPFDPLRIAVHHDHRIGQGVGGGTVGLQHLQQPALARTGLALVVGNQVFQRVPAAAAGGWRQASARQAAQDQPAQPPVVPAQGEDGDNGQRHPHLPGQRADKCGKTEPQEGIGQRSEPGRTQMTLHGTSVKQVHFRAGSRSSPGYSTAPRQWHGASGRAQAAAEKR